MLCALAADVSCACVARHEAACLCRCATPLLLPSPSRSASCPVTGPQSVSPLLLPPSHPSSSFFCFALLAHSLCHSSLVVSVWTHSTRETTSRSTCSYNDRPHSPPRPVRLKEFISVFPYFRIPIFPYSLKSILAGSGPHPGFRMEIESSWSTHFNRPTHF